MRQNKYKIKATLSTINNPDIIFFVEEITNKKLKKLDILLLFLKKYPQMVGKVNVDDIKYYAIPN